MLKCGGKMFLRSHVNSKKVKKKTLAILYIVQQNDSSYVMNIFKDNFENVMEQNER